MEHSGALSHLHLINIEFLHDEALCECQRFYEDVRECYENRAKAIKSQDKIDTSVTETVSMTQLNSTTLSLSLFNLQNGVTTSSSML